MAEPELVVEERNNNNGSETLCEAEDIDEATLKKLDEVKADFNNKISSPWSSLKTKAAPQKTGFDCEFIEKPKEVVTDCPICLLVLRNPHQVTCCGHVYCRVCIQRIEATGKGCPTCKEMGFKIFPDKSHHKHLYSFKVWCCNQDQGCNWSGELGQLAAHLNDEYALERRMEGCDYAIISCVHCADYFPRKAMTKHEEIECFLRPYTCPICKVFKGSYKAIVGEHQPECEKEEVACPNECGEKIPRGLLGVHLKKTCPKIVEMVRCEFSFAGCMERMIPEKVPNHLEEGVTTHLSLLGNAQAYMRERVIQLQTNLDSTNYHLDNVTTQYKMMKSNFEAALDTITALRREVEELRMLQQQDRQALEVLRSNSSILPVTVVLDEYERRKSKGDMGWTSRPFYTHPKGYRMCLWVDVGGNGQGKGIYISVFLSVLKGEHDNNLSWPFKGSIAVQLMNQAEKKSHHIEVIKYHDSTPKASAGRIMDEGRKAKPWGKGKFIRHEEIRDGGFALNDAIKFYVTKA